jgi:putative FmdB family regulatory protein
MPLYEYQCEACGRRFERIVKFSDPPLEVCPTCGGKIHKLVSSPAFHLKGTGWYATDYSKKDKGSSSESESGSTSGAAAPSSEASKTGESKEAKDSKASSDTKSSADSGAAKEGSGAPKESKAPPPPAPSKS